MSVLCHDACSSDDGGQQQKHCDDAARSAQRRYVAERRLKEWQNYQRSHRSHDDQCVSRGFIDVCIGNAVTRRLLVDLCDAQTTHDAVHYFSHLLSGTSAQGRASTQQDFIGACIFHIDKLRGFACLGNIISNDDEACVQIEEKACTRKAKRGDIVMFRTTPNSTTTCYAIMLRDAPGERLQHNIVGTISDGYDVLDAISKLPTNTSGQPYTRINIILCGMLTGRRPATKVQ